MACLDNIIEINKSDCIGNSRETINSNFTVLKDKVCSLDTKTDVVEKKSIYYVPLYGIIMYYGDITLGGTDFELNGYGKESKNLQAFAICDGSNGTPDMRDRFVVGAGGSYTQKTFGPQAPGAPVSTTNDTLSLQFSSVRLTVDEMPIHNHNYTEPNNGAGHNHGYTEPNNGDGHTHGPNSGFITKLVKFWGGGGSGFDSEKIATSDMDEYPEDSEYRKKVDKAKTGISINHQTTGITISDKGGSMKHENRPPYIALGYIMRVK